MKTCRQCGEAKLISEFYRHQMMADGHLNKCKECIKANARAYGKAHPDSVRIRTRQKAMRPACLEKMRQWWKRNPEIVKAMRDRWAAKNREKAKAEWTLHNAVRDGKVVRGTVCQRCGSMTHIEAHHPDYSKPLEVEWLCTKCHGKTRHK